MSAVSVAAAGRVPPLRRVMAHDAWRKRLIRRLLWVAVLAMTVSGARRPLLAAALRLFQAAAGFFARIRGSSATLEFVDPTFGAMHDVVYRLPFAAAWEDFLNALGFPATSAVRGHIRQLFERPELDRQLQHLFDALSGDRDRLSRESVRRFSRSIEGHIHVLLQIDTRVGLVPVTAEDDLWITEGFDHVFPAERPLDRSVFPAFAKLVLLRRVVRTLIECIGMERLQSGLVAPLVIDVTISLSPDQLPFRVHTVAPASTPATCNEHLGVIKEASP